MNIYLLFSVHIGAWQSPAVMPQEAALKIYAHALQLDPHYALAWHNKGVLHNERGELTDAKECYLNALRDRIMSGQPEFKTVACNLSSVLVKLQEHEAACRLLSEVSPIGLQDRGAGA